MFSKFFKFQITLAVCLAVISASPLTSATEADTERVEDSTVSPIADMAVIESEMKTSTERPPTMEQPKQDEKLSSQRHTVADFIIHPLIAFKPRNPEEEGSPIAGKQSDSSTSSTTPSPWQLFGFNAGQGLSSSVSNLAGSVTGWINDRIQLPGLMETPVRESTTSSTTSTTTTTPRPDVVVRVQHKATTRRPLISIDNRNRPNRPNFDSEENDDEDDYEEHEDNDENENEDNESSNENVDNDNDNDNESSNEREEGDNSDEEDNEVVDKDQDEEDETEETADDDDEENSSQRPNNKRRPLRNNNKNKQRQGNRPQNTRRRVPNRRQRPVAPARRRPANNNAVSEEDGLNDDDYGDIDPFYYGARPSTKRSQSNQNFIQRSQQQLLNQIRQLTRGQTPGEIGSAIRRAQANNGANRRRQQATLFVNRNGQTVYMAPELAQYGQPQYQQVYAQPIVHKAPASGPFPQPPLTVPLKQKGQPVQYITIPWSQLGISPPSNIVSITEGIQAQPFILNIPQSAINTMQNQARPGQANRKKKRPQLITAEAVPLLAEASLMDIFKPPQIPPSRTSNTNKPSASKTPVLVASKPSSTKTTSILQQRVRPGTVVEKAPSMEYAKNEDSPETSSPDESKNDGHGITGEKEYILVGKDEELGLTRQVEPVYGDARYVRLTGNSQFYDVLPRRRFSIRRGGRELTQSEDEKDQKIPVQVISEPTNSPQPDPKVSESVESQKQGMETEDPKPDTKPSPVIQPENTQQPPQTTTT